MKPTLRNGALVIALSTDDINEGDIVVDTVRGIMKRVSSKHGTKLHLFGDNHKESSEHIVCNTGLYKVVWPARK